MGLTISSVFSRLFGKKQMRILMGELEVVCFCELALINAILLTFSIKLCLRALSIEVYDCSYDL